MDSATRSSRASDAAFTLVEVMVSLGLASLLAAGVLTSVLFLTKSQALLAVSVESSAVTRSALEHLADDIRQMSSVTIGSNGFSGQVPDAAGTGKRTISYAYDASLGLLSRTENGRTLVVLDRLQSCSFTYYGAGSMDLGQTPPRMNRGSALGVGTSTKVKQIQLVAVVVSATRFAQSAQQVVSAQFSLRS